MLLGVGPAEVGRRRDQQRQDPHEEDDDKGAFFRPPLRRVREWAGDGQVAIRRHGAQVQDGRRAKENVQRDPQIADDPAEKPRV